jgi:CheY-like chemotaxis protein
MSPALSDSELEEQLRSALSRLDDLGYLQNHPLAGLIPADTSSPEPSGVQLRAALIEAIEQLKPSADTPAHSSRRRQYVILHERYIRQRPAAEIEKMLGLGERQLRREHHRAIAALAILLRARLAKSPVRLEPHADLASTLEEAVRRLAPAPRTFGLAELFEEVSRMAEQIGRFHAAPPWLMIEVRPSNLSAYADRGILHQLLLKLLHFIVNEDMGSNGIFLSARAVDDQVLISLHADCIDPISFEDEDLQLGRLLVNALGAQLAVELLDEAPSPARIFRAAFALPGGVRLRKVLVVDDEPSAAELFRTYLSGLSYEVVVETNPAQTLERAEIVQPDAIVLDVMMPGMDGWELFQRLRSLPALKDVPIVVCSVINEAELARALGATRFLKKPVLRQHFIQALDEILARV